MKPTKRTPPRPALGQQWERPAKKEGALPTRLRVEKCLPLGMLLVSFRVPSSTGHFYWGRPMKMTAVRLFEEYTLVEPALEAA